MLKKILSAIVIMLLAAPCSVLAADDIIVTMRDRYQSIETFQAQFTQYLTHRETGSVEKREGELVFKKPLLISWSTKAPTAETLIVNDKEIWDYIEDEELAYRYPRDLVDDSRSLIKVVTGQALLTEDYDVAEAGTEGKLVILQLYPKDPIPTLVEARLYVDPEKGYIQRAVITDFYGNENDVRFTSFLPNARVSSSVFRFTPPKGVDVEDRVEKPAIEGTDLF